MKTLFLSIKMFFKKPFLNILLILELALVSSVFVAVFNALDYSNNYLKTLENSKYRFLYCSGIEVSPEEPYANKLENKYSQYPSFVGTLKKEQGFAFLKGDKKIKAYVSFVLKQDNNEKITNEDYESITCKPDEIADVFYYDKVTLETFKYPLSDGEWSFKESNDCIIGGEYAKHYKVGDVINTLVIDKDKNIINKDFYVKGKLSFPQYCVDTSHSGINHEYSASDIFDNINQEQLLIISQKGSDCLDCFSVGNMSAIMYLDKNCPQDELNEIISKTGKGYINTDKELINKEKESVNEYVKILFPFLLVLLIVSISGILSMTMLMILRNIDTYKIYYLCGCTKKRSIFVSVLYSLIYFVFSGFLTMFILKKIAQGIPYMEHYFILNNKNIVVLLLIYLVIVILSIIIPFSIISKINISELLQKSEE